MTSLDRYLEAATRTNTRRGYRSAIRHFEEVWGGFLPATADAVARYLADHAESLALNTLRLRLAALSQWHLEQGFPDPTKAPVVRKVLKGIGELYPAREQQARPLQIEELARLDDWLAARIQESANHDERAAQRRATRDRALILLGFWRAFRGDELNRLRVEHIQVIPGEGMTLYLPRTKTDHSARGSEFQVPALSRLCPVDAYLDWISLTQLTEGPVFRRINRWGAVGDEALHPNSLIPLLRKRFVEAGLAMPDHYSGQSLRRGFASWANANHWDVKSLMDYVGWKDMKSALRYIERPDAFGRERIERALAQTS